MKPGWTHALLALVLAVASGCHDPAAPVAHPTGGSDVRPPDQAPPPTPEHPPGPRLPDAIAPLAYDLTLELDPDTAGFRGHAEIRVRASAPTEVVWLNAVDLDIESASARDAAGALAPLVAAGEGEQMQGFRLPAPLAAGGETTLVFDYLGGTSHDEQGLFRQQAGGAWYLYAQSESVFARRILPCFDEPRWKPTWHVRLAIPHGMGGFGNAPEVGRHDRSDGRLEIELAPTPPMASYLLSVAVGPFDVVPAGTMGRAHVPVRVIVPAGAGAHATMVARRLPPVVDALEAYFDEGLPIAKLDLVGVPHFFGGMENPGLITLAEHALTGDPDEPTDSRTFIRFAGHELAHLWLGDLVTPAWWDELWLAEAFATWLGDKVATTLDGFDDAPLRIAQAREHALDADGLPDAHALRRPVEHGDDAEAEFDAIAYDKGAAVLAMLEHWIGEGELRTAIRSYVRAHALGTATSADFIHAFATTPYAMADVLTSYTDHPGVPVVELALRCDVHPARITARLQVSGVSVPLCVRYPGGAGPAETCGVVVGDHAELVLSEASSCPAWVIGNADGAGYYVTQWLRVGIGPVAPISAQTPAERLAYGSDVANAVARGELPATAALAELTRLAATGDPYAEMAALAIARAIAPLVDDTTAPRWWDFLAARFADRLTPDAILSPGSPVARAVRDRLLDLLPGDHLPAATVHRVRAELDRVLAAGLPAVRTAPIDVLVAVGGPGGGHARVDKLRTLAARATEADLRDELYVAAGKFGPEEIAATVDALTVLHGDGAWPAVRGYLTRPGTAAAAWTAVVDRLTAVLASLTPEQASELVATASALCETRAAAIVAVALEPHLAGIPDGRKTLDRALAVADRCVARRARAGALMTALRP